MGKSKKHGPIYVRHIRCTGDCPIRLAAAAPGARSGARRASVCGRVGWGGTPSACRLRHLELVLAGAACRSGPGICRLPGSPPDALSLSRRATRGPAARLARFACDRLVPAFATQGVSFRGSGISGRTSRTASLFHPTSLCAAVESDAPMASRGSAASTFSLALYGALRKE